MTLATYNDIEQRSPEWYDQRRGIVTASVVAKLVTPATLSVANNDESRGLTMLLVAERITGYTHPTRITDDMWRGVLHEPIARDVYGKNYAPVTECGFMVRQEDGWTLGYSPDGLVGDDGLIEVKCPRAKTHLNTILTDEVPAYHMAQMQAGLLVSGRDWCDFVSFHGGMPLYRKRVHPDPAWHEAITAAAVAFEQRADEMTNAYVLATAGLPATEHVPDLADVELKL